MESITDDILKELVGTKKVKIFHAYVDEINKLYEMDHTWNNGGKRWTMSINIEEVKKHFVHSI